MQQRTSQFEFKACHPIFIFSVFSNSLKKIIYNRLILFVSKHNILTDTQNGFRENKSTETASQTFIENIQ
jgi:hypothetical protein